MAAKILWDISAGFEVFDLEFCKASDINAWHDFNFYSSDMIHKASNSLDSNSAPSRLSFLTLDP